MKELYLIRHGNANYMNDELSDLGRRQVHGLYRVLEERLPEGISCAVIVSGSGRTTETAKELIPLFDKKAGKRLYLQKEPGLSQMRGMGSDDQIIANGKDNLSLIEKYSDEGDCVFFVGHDKILITTGNAIADDLSIELPDYLKIKEYEESYVLQTMKGLGISRKEAIENVKEWWLGPIMKIPPMAEASALFFDLQGKEFEYLLPLEE